MVRDASKPYKRVAWEVGMGGVSFGPRHTRWSERALTEREYAPLADSHIEENVSSLCKILLENA